MNKPTEDNYEKEPIEPVEQAESVDECGPPYCTTMEDEQGDSGEENRGRSTENTTFSQNGAKQNTEYNYSLAIIIFLILIISKSIK